MRARSMLGAAALLACAIAAYVMFVRGGPDAPPPKPPPPAPSPIPRVRLAELRHQPPASVAGTVGSAGAAVAGATVCARADDDSPTALHCATSDGDGAWLIGDLAPAHYAVWALADGLVGAPVELTLAADEARGGVALQLAAGAAIVRGVVRDVRGAPIAGAAITLYADGHAPSGATHSGSDGAFTAWLAAGDSHATAAAEGYVPEEVGFHAPDEHVAIALTPGGTIAGTVVDATTHAPIADAQVGATGADSVRSDAAGGFRIASLRAGRYKPTAASIGGYGEARESVRVAIGQRVEGIVIEVHPVAVVAGRLVGDDPRGPVACAAEQGDVWLTRYGGGASYIGKTLDDGVVLLEGVVPGTYEVQARCKGWLPQRPYPDLVVRDSDVDDLTWHVLPSARVAGRVHARGGEPIAGAHVQLRSANEVSFASAVTGADGAFTSDGLGPGAVEVEASADGFLETRKSVTTQAVMAGQAPPSCDIVLDRGGAIAGSVVDASGVPMPGVRIAAEPADSAQQSGGGHTDHAGEFRIDTLAPGVFHVAVDSQVGDVLASSASVDVTVAANATVDVHLVATSPGGAIDGTVVDDRGAPIGDAYVTAMLEDPNADNAWKPHYLWTSPPVLAGVDGSFHVGGLSAGPFSVRAVRPGGAETVVPHLAPGARATVVIRPTGVLAGTVVTASGAPVTDATINATDRGHDVSREERAYFTGGAFALRDLPAGSYKVTVDGDPRSAQTIELADGEQRVDLRLVVQLRYALHGRVVSHAGAPLGAWKVEVPRLETVETGPGRALEMSEIEVAVTAPDGTFVVHDLPAGDTEISVFDPTHGGDSDAVVKRTVTLGGDAPIVEAGDVAVP